MNHTTIQEKSLIERYHQGLLPPEEEAQFEEHFTSCEECQKELEMARGFRLGMRSMAAEDVARQAVGVGVFAWLAQLSRSGQLGLVVGGLLLAAALPTAWFTLNNQDLRSTAETARSTVAALEERYEKERQAGMQLEQRLVESERLAAEERSEIAARLEQEIANNEQQAKRLESLRQPLINTPVFILSTLRSTDEQTQTLSLAALGEWFALAVDLDDDSRIENYRATVLTASGERLWRRDGLLPNNLETLMITFPASFFGAGDYRLSVEGLLVGGGYVDVERYSFRVVGR